MYYRGKFYLYYKGEQMGEEMTFGPSLPAT